MQPSARQSAANRDLRGSFCTRVLCARVSVVCVHTCTSPTPLARPSPAAEKTSLPEPCGASPGQLADCLGSTRAGAQRASGTTEPHCWLGLDCLPGQSQGASKGFRQTRSACSRVFSLRSSSSSPALPFLLCLLFHPKTRQDRDRDGLAGVGVKGPASMHLDLRLPRASLLLTERHRGTRERAF